ncbi:serine hydrolase [Pseudonocardia sp. CA-142604]|uniref:serine hydrolase n=1 Tax=Pseudonocardia sp. CA-142604 TaxID=3240024 RepID=UPI003D89E004
MTVSAPSHRTQFLVIICTLALLVAVPVVAASGLGHAEAKPSGEMAFSDASARPSGQLSAAIPGVEALAAPVAPAPRTGLAQAAVDAAQGTAASATELAVAVLDRETGELALGARGGEPYYTASLSKVLVAVDILDRRRLDGLAVADADIALLNRALGPSDDNAMNALWSRFDGVGGIGRVSSRVGLTGTTGPRDPSQWGEVSMSAEDTVRTWQYLLEDMPAADRDLLASAMEAAPARAADGFNQAFGLLAPAVDGPDAPGAVAKQGWMCCFSGKYYIHSTGAVGGDRRFLMALLARVPRTPGWEAARQEMTRIATAAVQATA